MMRRTVCLISGIVFPLVQLIAGTGTLVSTSDQTLNLRAYEQFNRRWVFDSLILFPSGPVKVAELLVVNASGSRSESFFLNIAGSAFVDVTDASRSKDGAMLAVCGYSGDNQGRGAHFLALISTSSKHTDVIRMDVFRPHDVAIASDGSVWAAGRSFLDSDKAPDGSALILRRFSAKGDLVAAFVQQKTFRRDFHAADPANRLVANGDGGVWFCPIEGRMIEASDAGVLKDFNGIAMPNPEPDPQWAAEGLATLPSGDVYIATGGDPSTKLWWFDASARSFRHVSTDGNVGWLYGSDGDHLVFRNPLDRSGIRFQLVKQQ